MRDHHRQGVLGRPQITQRLEAKLQSLVKPKGQAFVFEVRLVNLPAGGVCVCVASASRG
jgi:hypothetical protein